MLSSAEAAARERASRRNSVPARTKMKMVDDELSPKGYNRSNSGPVPMSASSNSIGSDAGKEEIPASIKKNSKEVTMHLRLYGHSNVSGDYFNNIKKCWEPLVAPFSLACLYEETANRGVGVTLRFTSALRLNISVALVRTLHDALRAVQVANDTARDEYYANKVDDATADGSNRMPRSSDQHENQYRGSLDSYSVMSGQVHSAYSGTSNGPNMSDGTQMLSDNDRMQYFTRTTVTATRKIAATFDNSNAFLMNRRPVRYNHIPTQSLRHNARVGFSILNLTGQPLRYVQYFSSSRATMVHYLDHNQRGLLNFVASKTSIRNNQVVEEQFGHFKQEVLQRFGQKALQSSARRSKEIGHHIAVQICGYKWLSSLQADALGIYFKDLHSILGCLNATTIANDALKKRTLSPGEETDKEIIDWGTKNALKLVTEVRPYNGGRMLLLRSVFAVKNSTTHDINIVTNFTSRMPELPADRKSDHFSLKSGETFFIPLSLINESVLRSNQPNSKSLNREDKGTQLGCLWLRPSSMKPVRSELGPSSQFVKSMTYSGNPIVLKDVLLTSESSQNVMSEESSTLLSDGKFKQLSCALSTRVTDPRGDMFDDNIKDYSAFASDFQDGRDEDLAGDVYGFSAAPVVNSDKLPPFCYNIEVQTSGSDGSNSFLANNDRTGGRFLSMFTSGKSLQDEVSKIPLQYTIGKQQKVFRSLDF